jgi:glycosyltransferase involved in cell wall biosynthesis
MKILHIISSGGMYGAEAVILNLSRALNEGSHQSILGVFSNSSQPNVQLHERALQEGIESHLISCNGQIDRTVPSRIRELARQTGVDVVHAHGYKADVYAYLAMKKSSTPLVSTSHGWIDHDISVRLYGKLDRFILRSYSGVVAVSNAVKQQLLGAGVSEGNIRLIRNGIDLRAFQESSRSQQTHNETDCPLSVGLVGRLSQEKGVDLFLQAATEVLLELPHTKFFVVGDGPLRIELESLIEHLGIAGSASLLGRKDDMPSFYNSLDLLVSASRQEGLPIALLEGMASGLPLVATAVGAVPTLVQTDRTGILVPANNVKALAKAISRLLLDTSLRKRFGTAARALIAEEYSATRMASDYLSLYQEAVIAKRQSA